MAGESRRRRQSKSIIKRRLKKWVGNRLDCDEWVGFPRAEIAKQAKVSKKAVSRELLHVVANVTDRSIEVVQEIHRCRWESKSATPFDIFCIQHLRQKDPKKWTFERIASLVGFSYTTVRNHTNTPTMGLPPDTSGKEISDELREVLAEELGIGINPDGTTHRLNQVLTGYMEKPHEVRQDDLGAEVSQPDVTAVGVSELKTPVKEEPPQQDSDIAENTDALHSPRAGYAHPRLSHYGDNVRLPERILIYIVQRLHEKSDCVDAIVREGLPVTEAQVYKCLDHQRIPMPDHIPPNYERLMIERQLYPIEPMSQADEDHDKFLWRGDDK